jgi:hypothetical protein
MRPRGDDKHAAHGHALPSESTPSLVLLYWVIDVDGTSFEASGYMFDGDRVLPVRCA